jgi:prevent-host-death family protein
MDAVKIADLKNNLSRHLARVRQGREITVFDRDTPVARIVPFVPGAATSAHGSSRGDVSDVAERIAELTKQGVLSPGDSQALATWADDHRPVRLLATGASGVDVLIQMRRESTR